jgi:hypothetical protein
MGLEYIMWPARQRAALPVGHAEATIIPLIPKSRRRIPASLAAIAEGEEPAPFSSLRSSVLSLETVQEMARMPKT